MSDYRRIAEMLAGPAPSSMGQDETYAALMERKETDAGRRALMEMIAMGGAGALLTSPAARGGEKMFRRFTQGVGGLGLAGMATDLYLGSSRGPGQTDIDGMYRDAAGIPRVPTQR